MTEPTRTGDNPIPMHYRTSTAVDHQRYDDAPRSVDVLEVWWCAVLHLAWPKGDQSPGARTGLSKNCQKEHHGSQCGWYWLIRR